ncbi:MAG: hypothetical protein V7700_15080 [Halioglobus sp.]
MSDAIASMLSFQAAGVDGTKFDTPKTDRFAANSDAAFSEYIFNEWSGTPAVA